LLALYIPSQVSAPTAVTEEVEAAVEAQTPMVPVIDL
jgi:hypothetical protein